MTVVLDSSALLAYLQDEPGSEVVERILNEAFISSVNWAEVVQKSVAAGVKVKGMLEELQALGLTVEIFTVEDGELAGLLWTNTKNFGLSLGDRACLSLGLRMNVSVLTSDRAWNKIGLDLNIILIR